MSLHPREGMDFREAKFLLYEEKRKGLECLPEVVQLKESAKAFARILVEQRDQLRPSKEEYTLKTLDLSFWKLLNIQLNLGDKTAEEKSPDNPIYKLAHDYVVAAGVLVLTKDIRDATREGLRRFKRENKVLAEKTTRDLLVYYLRECVEDVWDETRPSKKAE